MATKEFEGNLPRKRLARIRCLQDCIECFRHNGPLPKSLCYIPAEIEFKLAKNTGVSLYLEADQNSSKTLECVFDSDSQIFVSGEELCNSQGQWAKVVKVLTNFVCSLV